VTGSLKDVAREAGWESAKDPGKWVAITRTFRDGSTQKWWGLEIEAGPYGPDKTERVVVATTDPQTLPDFTTCYLVTNLPAPSACPATQPLFAEASLEEVIRLYGLRMWVEQSRHSGQTRPGLVTVSGEKRSGHPTTLAVSLLRVLVLLVPRQSPLLQYDDRRDGGV